jgi:hypothetical protein
MRILGIVLVGVVAAVSAACGGPDASAHAAAVPEAGVSVTPELWARVASERVFFGHQSVGNNILRGIREMSVPPGAPPVQIVNLASGPAPAGPVLLHREIGQNGDPFSKIKGFQEAVDTGVGTGVDVAAMKFCFWDIRAGTDVKKVFAEYERTLTALEARHPSTRFVHVTVPLFAPDVDWRANLRRLIGRPVPRTLDNARRQELSELIRTRYAGREPVFDLARYEAAAETEHGVPYMAAELTTDGGHLNEEGRQRLAVAFLHAVAAAADGDQASR